MIISLRGTHGSGKSHLVRTLIDCYRGVAESVDGRGRPIAYELVLTNGSKLYVVGSYVNVCGGCDGIQPYSLIWPLVERLAKKGHVIFEGALVSSSYGNIGRASEKYGDAMVFAFLDTPLSVCLKRINARRRARGVLEPVNPKNTTYKAERVVYSIGKIRDEFGRRVVVLNYHKAVPQILGLLYSKGRTK